MRPIPLLAALLLLLAWPAAAEAARHRLDLPAGRLGDALVALGRQAGVTIGVTDPALAAERVPALRGSMTVGQALDRLLRGTRARFVRIDARTWRIVRRPPRAPPRARPSPPVAHQAPPLPEQHLFVTATRRPIRLASYGGAADIIDGLDPALLAGPRGSEALVARLPVLSSTHLGAGRNKLFIRGVADSSFSGTVQATTGQYLGETRLSYNAPDPDLRLLDLDRIEILQGPQGTLYGAGSLGGIIRIVPNPPDPDRTEGWAALGASLTEHGEPGADAAAMLNLPLDQDRLALRLVAYGAREGGYIDDTGRGRDDVNDTRIGGGRAALRLDAGGGWTFDLGLAAQHIEGDDAQFADRGAPPLTRASAVAQPFSSRYALADLTVRREWDRMRFAASLGLVRQDVRERYDSTRTGDPPRVFDQDNEVEMATAEARLSGEGGGGRLVDWIVGASFVANESELRRRHGPAAAPAAIPGVRNFVRETAMYGEARFRLAPGITFAAGGRFAWSHLSGASLDVAAPVLQPLAGARADRSDLAFLPSAALSAEVAPDLTLFARYQESFRPGGLSVSDQFVQRFRSDDLATLEAGARYGRPGAGAFDAAAVFAFTRWTDIQADTVTLTGFPVTFNIGDGRIWSLDLRLGWRPAPGLALEAAALFNDSKVTNPFPGIDITGGAPLPNVADVSARFAADWRTQIGDGLDLRLDAAARYVGLSRLGVGVVLGEEQGEYLDLSLGAALDHGPHTVSLTATNLLDEAGNRFAVGSPFTLLDQRQVTPLRPRTLRLGWQLRF